jgi:hypothetical protein
MDSHSSFAEDADFRAAGGFSYVPIAGPGAKALGSKSAETAGTRIKKVASDFAVREILERDIANSC